MAAYKANEISDADIRVILRGKALEFYSRHYGQVFTSADEPLSIRHALGGINQLLDEDTGERPAIRPPSFSRSRISTCGSSRRNRREAADDVNKSLFGTAIRQTDFEDRGWVEERNRDVTAFRFTSASKIRKRPRKEMKTEIDQAHFLIGAAMPNSGINLEQELSKDTGWFAEASMPCWSGTQDGTRIQKSATPPTRSDDSPHS